MREKAENMSMIKIFIVVFTIYPLMVFSQTDESKVYPSPYPVAKFSARSKVYKGSGDAIKKKLNKYYKNFLSNFKYDSMIFGLRFLEHFEKHQKIKADADPCEAYKDFQPCALDEMKSMASHCVGVGQFTCMNLARPLGDYAYLMGCQIVSKYKDTWHEFAPTYHHVVTAIPFSNPKKSLDMGYVLLDFAWPYPEIIVIKENEKTLVKQGDEVTWEFSIKKAETEKEKDKIIWRIIETKKPDIVNELKIDNLDNPDEAITKPTTFTNSSFLVFKYRGTGKVLSGFVQNYMKEEISFMSGDKTTKFSFGNKEKIKEFIFAGFAVSLGEDPTILYEKIEKIINDAKILRTVRQNVFRAN